MLGLSPATITRGGFAPDHTSITHWRSSDSEPARWFLQRFNDATHLADLKLTEQP
jgi:hypothetical protein